MSDIFQQIVRDVGEFPLLVVVLGLPLVLGVLAARARSPWGWVALALVAALLLAYVGYYAVPLPNPGAAPAALMFVSIGLIASVAAGIGYFRGKSRSNGAA